MILAYHNVVPDTLRALGDRSLHIPLTRFREQLDFLASGAVRVVGLEQLLNPEGLSECDGPFVAITADDAYRGFVELAIPELVARALPATLFVAPGILGDQTLWWDGIAGASQHGLPAAVRDRILRAGGLMAPFQEHAKDLPWDWTDMPAPMRTATVEDLKTAATVGGIRYGSHTWSHVSLTNVPCAEMRRELTASRQWLEEQLPESHINVLSYPFGHHSPTVEREAANAGYHSGLALNAAWIDPVPSHPAHAVPRFNVPAGLSMEGFRLRLAWRVANPLRLGQA